MPLHHCQHRHIHCWCCHPTVFVTLPLLPWLLSPSCGGVAYWKTPVLCRSGLVTAAGHVSSTKSHNGALSGDTVGFKKKDKSCGLLIGVIVGISSCSCCMSTSLTTVCSVLSSSPRLPAFVLSRPINGLCSLATS
jgi:hypothetical protein